MEIKTINGLNPREYEHPLDQKALNTLEKTAGLDTLIRKFYDLGIEKILRVQYTGSNIRANSTNFPKIHDLLEEVCETLYLQRVPELYIQRGDNLEGITMGVENPIIILDTDAIEFCSPEELKFVFGKQVGHIKSEHMLYHEIGWILPIISDALAAPTLGISNLFTAALQIALINWARMSAYTSDRAGLLACQDVKVATGVMMKIAGLPKGMDMENAMDEFVIQAREFKGFDTKSFSKVVKYAGAFFSEQPWTIARANQFFTWTDSGAYKKVIDRETEIRFEPEAPLVNFCPSCGHKLEVVGAFCPACGGKLG